LGVLRGRASPEILSQTVCLTLSSQSRREASHPHPSSAHCRVRADHMPHHTCLRRQQAERAKSGQKKQRVLLGCSWRVDRAIHWRCHVGVDKESTAAEEGEIRVYGRCRQACRDSLTRNVAGRVTANSKWHSPMDSMALR
jgi:hypothetical protein